MNKRSHNIGADAALLSFSKVAQSGMGMVITMLLTRTYTPTDLGTYHQILMVINLVTSLLMLGLPKSLNYFLARAETEQERKNFLSFYYTLNTILSGVVGIALVLSTDLIADLLHNPAIRSFVYFLALFPWSKIICSSIENLLIVYKKTKALVLFRILNSLFLLLSVILAQLSCMDFAGYMILYVIAECIFALAVYLIAAKLCGGLRPYMTKRMMINVFGFSIPLGLASVVGTLNIELDKFVINGFLDTDRFGIYSTAAKELPIAIIASAFTAVLLPRFARLLKKEKTEEAISLWGNTITLTYTIICFIVIGCFTFAPEAITVLYSDAYLDGTAVFRIYTLLLLLRVTYYGIILNSKGKTKFIFWCSLISLALNMVLNYTFCFLFRANEDLLLTAPAVATVISTVIMAVIQLVATCRTVDVSFAKIQPWRQLAKITIINIAFAVVFYSIKLVLPLDIYLDGILPEKFSHGNVLEVLVLAVVWGMIYFVIMRKPIKRLWKKLKSSED